MKHNEIKRRYYLLIDNSLNNQQLQKMETLIQQLKDEINCHKKAEERLSKSERRYKDLLESVTDYIYTVQISEGKVIDTIHGTGCEIVTGYSPNNYADNSELWYQMIYEPDRPAVLDQVSNVLTGKSASPIEHRIIHKDGSIRWVRHIVVPDVDDKGLLIEYSGLIRDITEEKLSISVNSTRLHLKQFVETNTLENFLQETLNEIEKLTDSKISYYAIVEGDQYTIKQMIFSTQTKSKINKINIMNQEYNISDRQIWKDCIENDKPIILNENITQLNSKNNIDRNIQVFRELVVPIKSGKKLKAIVAVGNKQSDYNQKDVDILSSLADFSCEIVERRQAEEKLLRADQRLRLHMEQSPLGFIEWDDQFHAIEWNATCQRIFGYTREEAIGQHPKDLILPLEVRELVDGIFERLMNQEGGHHSINTNITKDGRVIICEWFNTTLISKEGEAIGVDSLVRDITEQKHMEEELVEYREHLEELVRKRTIELEFEKNKAQQYLDIAGVILVAIDKSQTALLINQEGCKVLGYDAGDIIGKNWFEMFVPERIRPDVIQGFQQLINGELQFFDEFENPVVTKDGQERVIQWKNAILRDENGEIIATLSSGKDITEEKINEEYINDLNKILTERAEALQEANKELESFAYTVSHDLRAPLRHIDGFMNLLQERLGVEIDETSQHYISEILDSAKLMGKLIDDLLSFSRTSRALLQYNKLDLEKIVHTIIENLTPDIGNRLIEWYIGKLPLVTGDGSLMQIVLTNLISNAVKFTRPREQAKIEINYKEKSQEIVIFVRDNGVGFDPTYTDKLFGVFQRLHHTNEFEGTGVGLATAQRIINRHGGKIWAESEVGQGATFYFTIPKKTGGK